MLSACSKFVINNNYATRNQTASGLPIEYKNIAALNDADYGAICIIAHFVLTSHVPKNSTFRHL